MSDQQPTPAVSKELPDAPTPPMPEGAEKVKSFEHPPDWRKGTITCVVKMRPGVPVDPLAFAKLITVQVKLLQSTDKEQHGKRVLEWTLTEAAVIGEQACFTVMAVSKEWLDKAAKAAKAKDKKEAPPPPDAR